MKERNVVLYMKCVRDTAKLYFGGSAGQQRVPSYLLNFDIPLSPKGKQKETNPMFMNKSSEPRPCRKKASAFLTMLCRKWSGLILGSAD